MLVDSDITPIGNFLMVCDHLAELEKALIESGAQVTFRGAAWTQNCREWVYFNVVLDTDAIKQHFSFPPCVMVHENKDPKTGLERGFECTECKDAIMGLVEGGPLWRVL